MKTYYIIAVSLLFLFFLQAGCSKNDSDENGNNCTPQFPGQQVTYSGYVNNIITTHCLNRGCHNGGGNGPGDFRTYQGVLEYASRFFFRVIQDRADMPQGNAPLPKSIRDSLDIWVKNCSPF